MKMFLTSQGLVPETTPHFLKLLGRTAGVKVAFIPTAADYKRVRGGYVSNDMARLKELGFSVEEFDLRKENEKSLKKKLAGFDVVFVCGGNTYYLLKYVRESGFGKAVREFLDVGGFYVGVSAGSMIAGLNIESAAWKHVDRNTVGLNDLMGMNLVPFVLSVHIDDSNLGMVTEQAKKASYPVIALTDRQAVIVEGDGWKIVGPGRKMTFNIK
jgi:dipeptidase E